MILSVSNLVKTFSQGVHKVEAVKDVSFDLETGESLSITGPSGSGKTTVLSLLAGLDKPTSGSINISGSDVEKMTEAELSNFRAKNLGIVFQQFHLMPHLTALENVCLPLDINGVSNSIESAKEMLKQVGLGDRFDHLPSRLSGGEKQRVAIARALVLKPKLILADEPSGNLDFKTGQEVMDLLFDLVKKNKLSLILITHDRELSEKCDRQINMLSGTLT